MKSKNSLAPSKRFIAIYKYIYIYITKKKMYNKIDLN